MSCIRNFVISFQLSISLGSAKTLPNIAPRPRPKKVSGFWSSVGFKIGRVFFYMIYCIRGDQISHRQSMVAKRRLTNQANVHTPMSFKAQLGRIPIDPAVLAAIGHRFIATKNKIMNADARV